MDYKAQIASQIYQILTSESGQAPLTQQQIESLLEIPKDAKFGDWAFPCFTLAKSLRKAPPMIAQELMPLLEQQNQGEDALVSKIQPVGPYLNFTLNSEKVAKEVISSIVDGGYTQPKTGPTERVMIEYSQPNTHKAFHVGHIRNVALGDCLVRSFRWLGYPVIAANYIGDVGTHIAKCLWYYTNYFQGNVPQSHLGEFLGEMYVKATELLDFERLTEAPFPGVISARVLGKSPHPKRDEWQVVEIDAGAFRAQVVCGGSDYNVDDLVAYAPPGIRFRGRDVIEAKKEGVQSHGFLCSEAELGLGKKGKNKIYTFEATVALGKEVANLLAYEDNGLESQSVTEAMAERETGVRQTLQALERGEPKILELWQKTRQWSLDEFRQIYTWLGAEFDHYFYESEVADEGKEIVKNGLADGTLVRSEGAVGADLSDFNLPFFLLLKSDGTGLYSTKDLALAKRKFEEFQIDRSVYVVDIGQSLHFEQVFQTLKLLGYKNAEKCYHLAYGKVERPDGKMSSRKGNVILFSQLQERLIDKVKKEYLDKYENDWPAQEIEQAAHKIAVATIRYGMLNQDHKKNIVFDLNEWTARTGNTGPYLLYAYARISSILREAGSPKSYQPDWSQLNHEREIEILRRLQRFDETVQNLAERYETHLLCNYVYDLAKDFSRLYADCPILKASSEGLKQARLALADAVGRVLKQALELMGIQTLERM